MKVKEFKIGHFYHIIWETNELITEVIKKRDNGEFALRDVVVIKGDTDEMEWDSAISHFDQICDIIDLGDNLNDFPEYFL